MTSSPHEMPGQAPRHSTLRIAIIAVCIGVAFAAALGLRSAPQKKESAPVVLTAEQTIAQLPSPDGNSATNLALGVAFTKLREKNDDPVRWVGLGDVFAQMMRDTADEKFYGHAEMAYQFALRLEPGSADALAGMAWVTGGRHQFDRSREWADRALAADPGNAAACGILGDAALELGDYDTAYAHYQKMMDLKPDLSSWGRGAHLLYLTGDSKKGMWLMEKAVKAGGPFAENTAWCRAKLAMMLFHQGAYISAAQTLEPPLKVGSKNTQVLLAAGRIAAAREDFPAAEKYFQTVLESGLNHDALVALGDLRAVAGKMDEAEKFYAQVEALEAAQTARVGHGHLAMAKFYADHDRKPIEALRMAEVRKLTRNVNEADTLAWVYFKNGDQPHAIEAIKRALSQKTQDAEIHFHAGMIAAKFGDRVSAQNHLQTALSLSPRFSILQAPVAVATLEKLGNGSSAAVVPVTSTVLAR